jgi:hypothetical protein
MTPGSTGLIEIQPYSHCQMTTLTCSPTLNWFQMAPVPEDLIHVLPSNHYQMTIVTYYLSQSYFHQKILLSGELFADLTHNHFLMSLRSADQFGCFPCNLHCMFPVSACSAERLAQNHCSQFAQLPDLAAQLIHKCHHTFSVTAG